LTSKASQRGAKDPTAASGAIATADTTATSGHVNGHDDSNRGRRLATATSDGNGGHGGIVDVTAARQRRRADTSMMTATGDSNDIDS